MTTTYTPVRPASAPPAGLDDLPRLKLDARTGTVALATRVADAYGCWDTAEQPLGLPVTLTARLDHFWIGPFGLLDGRPDMSAMRPFGAPPATTPLGLDGRPLMDSEGKPIYRTGIAFAAVLHRLGEDVAVRFSTATKAHLLGIRPLHQSYLAAPEAARGLVPVVTLTGTMRTKIGSNSFHVPNFTITGWETPPAIPGLPDLPPRAPRTAPQPAVASAAPAPAPVPSRPQSAQTAPETPAGRRARLARELAEAEAAEQQAVAEAAERQREADGEAAEAAAFAAGTSRTAALRRQVAARRAAETPASPPPGSAGELLHDSIKY